MKILLIVVVLIILAVVALVVLKNIQSKKGAPKPLSRPKTPTPKAETVAPPPKQPEIQPAPVNALAVAEAHIQNQNYDEAVSELKRFLMTNPHHNQAMLKLLQTYGVQKQYTAFNQLHQKIHEIADGSTIREADFIKSLIDDEQANSVVANTVTPQESTTDTLDFNIEENKPELILDDLQPEATLQEELENFDLDFIDESQATNDVAQPVQEEPTLDFDLGSFDETDAPVASQPQPTTADEDFSLDFDTPEVTTSPAQEEPVLEALDFSDIDSDAVTQEETALAFDDFNLEETQPSQPETSASDINEIDALEDFNFEADELATSDLGTVTDVPESSDDSKIDDGLLVDDGLSLEGFESPVKEIEQTPTQEESTVADFDFSDVDFDQDLPNKQDEVTKTTSNDLNLDDITTEPLVESTKEDLDFTLDDKSTEVATDFSEFNFDDVADVVESDAPTIPLEDTLNINADPIADSKEESSSVNDALFSDDFGINIESDASEKTDNLNDLNVQENRAVDSATSIALALPTELNFTNTLDNAQITLNLAKKYLELGEYDSAKRLLAEVAQSGNASQQQNAQDLITRLG